MPVPAHLPAPHPCGSYVVFPFLNAEGTQSAGSPQTFQVTTAAGDVQLVWAQPAAQLLSFRAAIKVTRVPCCAHFPMPAKNMRQSLDCSPCLAHPSLARQVGDTTTISSNASPLVAVGEFCCRW